MYPLLETVYKKIIHPLDPAFCLTRAGGKPMPEIEAGTTALLEETRELFQWLRLYAESPENCGDKPDHRSAINRFLNLVHERIAALRKGSKN